MSNIWCILMMKIQFKWKRASYGCYQRTICLNVCLKVWIILKGFFFNYFLSWYSVHVTYFCFWLILFKWMKIHLNTVVIWRLKWHTHPSHFLKIFFYCHLLLVIVYLNILQIFYHCFPYSPKHETHIEIFYVMKYILFHIHPKYSSKIFILSF